MVHFFDTPIGPVACEISQAGQIGRCEPREEVPIEVISASRALHPELAEALLSLGRCPDKYTIEPSVQPTFAPHFWEVLLEVPFGETLSYGAFAERLGLPPRRYARAVARVLGRNSCFLLLPCHRIVMASGAIGGFRWGVETKAKLLAYEAERGE